MNKVELRFNDKTAFQDFNPNQTAVIIIDVWDDHWCKYYKELNESLAKRLGPFVDKLRSAGAKIIHSPCGSAMPTGEKKLAPDVFKLSDYSCMPYYYGSQARKNAVDCFKKGKAVNYSKRCQQPGDLFFKGVRQRGGKFCTCIPYCKRPFPRPWTRQHDAINVTDEDYVTDDIIGVSHILHRDKINRILYVGGALNACLIDRPHGMISKYDGVLSTFIRDLTISHVPRDDIFNIDHNDHTSHHWRGKNLREKFVRLCKTYNIQVQEVSLLVDGKLVKAPYRHVMSYKNAHEIQSRYIEKRMCPSILSEELLNAFGA